MDGGVLANWKTDYRIIKKTTDMSLLGLILCYVSCSSPVSSISVNFFLPDRELSSAGFFKNGSSVVFVILSIQFSISSKGKIRTDETQFRAHSFEKRTLMFHKTSSARSRSRSSILSSTRRKSRSLEKRAQRVPLFGENGYQVVWLRGLARTVKNPTFVCPSQGVSPELTGDHVQ